MWISMRGRCLFVVLFSHFQHAVWLVSNLEILGIEQYRHAQISSMDSTSSMTRTEILSVSKYQQYVNHQNAKYFKVSTVRQ